MSKDIPNSKQLRLVTSPLFLTIFIDALALGLIFPVLTPLILGNHPEFAISLSNQAKYLIYSLILASYPLGMFFGAPLLGEASDKYGRKPILLLCLVGNSLGLLTLGAGLFSHSLTVIIIGRLISGVTAGSFPIAQAAIVDTTQKSNKVANMGIIVAANALGFAAGPILGGILADRNIFVWATPSSPFFITAILPILTAILLVIVFKETSKGNKLNKLSWTTGFKNLYLAFKEPKTRISFSVYTLFLLGYFTFFNYIAAYIISKYHFGAESTGVFLTSFSLSFAIALLWIVPWLTKKLRLALNIKASLLIQVIALLILLLIPYIQSMWIICSVLAVVFALSYVSLLAYISNQASSEHQGRIMGISASLTALTWIIAPLLAGITGGINNVYPIWIATFILLLGTLMSRKLKD